MSVIKLSICPLLRKKLEVFELILELILEENAKFIQIVYACREYTLEILHGCLLLDGFFDNYVLCVII